MSQMCAKKLRGSYSCFPSHPLFQPPTKSKVDSLYKLFKKRPKAAERVEKSAEAWGQQKHDSR